MKASEVFYFKDGNLTWFRLFNGLNSKYLYYWILSPDGKAQLQRSTIGTSQAAYTIELLKKMTINLPSRKEQDAIVSTLFNYDALIENNLRRIELLENAARLIYREWFIKLNFPGREHTKIIDGVPTGWEKKKLIEIAEMIMGQSPESKYYNSDGNGLPFHQGVTNFGSRYVEHEMFSTFEGRIAFADDILCSVRAPVGRLNLTMDKIVIGRGISAMRSRTGNQSFLYYLLKNHFVKEDMIGTGSIFASVTKKQLENVEFKYPGEKLIILFEEISKPLDAQIKNIVLQNKRLRQARDLLLPKLMSGEIAV